MVAYKPWHRSPVIPAAYRAERPGEVAKKDRIACTMTCKGERSSTGRTGHRGKLPCTNSPQPHPRDPSLEKDRQLQRCSDRQSDLDVSERTGLVREDDLDESQEVPNLSK